MTERRGIRAVCLSSVLFLFLVVGASVALAGALEEVQERMRERLSRIDALKKEQLVGENLKGFLEPVEDLLGEQQALVRQENEDRRKIYRDLAEKLGVAAHRIGAIRARQIAERSARGVLIQDGTGNWTAKKE